MDFSVGLTILTLAVGILSSLLLITIAFIGYNYLSFERKMKSFIKKEMEMFRQENRKEMFLHLSQQSLQDCMINQRLGYNKLADTNMASILYYSDLSGKPYVTAQMIEVLKDDLIRSEPSFADDDRAMIVSVLHKYREVTPVAKEIEDAFIRHH